MRRREFLKLSLVSAASLASSPALHAEERPKVIRIGTQKGGFFFPAVRQRHTVEDALKPLGIDLHQKYQQSERLQRACACVFN